MTVTMQPPPSVAFAQQQQQQQQPLQFQMKEQYQVLRNRLEKLGYRDSLPIDAVPLVMKLLNDLVQTTESCRKLKIDNEEYMQHKKRMEGKLEPLKQEINQLTKENNMLHVHLINAADARDEREKKLQLIMRKYENEISDLKFLNKQLMSKMEVEQRKTDSERNRLGKTMEMIGVGIGREIDAKYLKNEALTSLARNATRVDIKEGLEPLDSVMSSRFPQPELHSVDMVRLAEAKVKSLEQEIGLLNLKNQDFATQIETLNEQIRNRDDEISRLGSLVESEKNVYTANMVINDPGTSAVSDQVKITKMDHLESQLQYLYDQVADLEKEKAVLEKEKALLHSESQEKLTVLTSELEEMYKKNDHLCEDLKSLEKMVGDFEKMTKKPVFKKALTENNTAKRPHFSASKVGEIYDELNKTKRELTKKDRKIEELEKSVKSSNSKVESTERELQAVQRELLDTVKRLVSLDDKTPETDNSTPTKSKVKAQMKSSSETFAQVTQLKTHVQNCEIKMKHLQTQRDQAESLLSHAKTQNEMLTSQLETEVGQVKILREKLLIYEKQLKEVTSERDRLKKVYQQLNEQYSSTRHQEFGSNAARDEQLNNLSKITVENERLQQENEELRSKYNLVNFSMDNINETSQLGDFNAQKATGNERNDYVKTKLAELEEENSNLNEKIQSLMRDLEIKRKEVDNFKKQDAAVLGNDIRRMIEEFDRERDHLNYEIDLKTEEVAKLKEQISDLGKQELSSDYTFNILKEENKQLQAQLGNQEREILSLKSQLDEMNIAKKNLELELEHVQERCNHLQSDLSALANENRQMAEEFAACEQQKTEAQKTCADQVQQLEYLEQIVQAKNDEREQIMASYRKIIQENSEVQNHLQSLDSDIQALRVNLSSKEKEVAQLHLDVQHAHLAESEAKSGLQETEMQISNLKETTRKQEIMLSEKEDLLKKAEFEIAKMHDVIMQVQRTRDEMMRDSAVTKSETSHLQKQIESLRLENNSLKHEVNQEKNRVETFEKLVAEERTKLIQTEIAMKDAIRAKQMMENRMNEWDKGQNQKLTSISSLSSKVIKLEEENKHLLEQIAVLKHSVSEQTSLLNVLEKERSQLHLKYEESEKKRKESIVNQARASLSTSPRSPRLMASRFSPRNSIGPDSVTQPPMKKHVEIVENTVNLQSTPAEKPTGGKAAIASSPSMLELKIMNELASTKKQLKRYEALLSDKFPDPIETSAPAPARQVTMVTSPSTDFKSPTSPSHQPPSHRSTGVDLNVQNLFYAGTGSLIGKSISAKSLRGMNKSPKSGFSTDNEDGAVATELLKTWKAQNEALRRELLSLNSLKTPMTSTPMLAIQNNFPPPPPPPMNIQQPQQQQNHQLRSSLGASEIVGYYQNEKSAEYHQTEGEKIVENKVETETESEMKQRLQLEEENRKLISVFSQVRNHLKSAQLAESEED